MQAYRKKHGKVHGIYLLKYIWMIDMKLYFIIWINFISTFKFRVLGRSYGVVISTLEYGSSACLILRVGPQFLDLLFCLK